MKDNFSFRRLLILLCLEAFGLLVFEIYLFFFINPGEISTIQYGVLLITALFSLVLAVLIFRESTKGLSRIFQNKKFWFITINIMAFAIISGAVTLLSWYLLSNFENQWFEFSVKSELSFQVAMTVIKQFELLILFVVLASIQLLIFLFSQYPHYLREDSYAELDIVRKAWVGFFIIIFTGLHWAVLASRLPMAKILPGWYWEVNNRPLIDRNLLMLVILVGMIGVGIYLLERKMPPLRTLILFILAGYLLQLSFGLVEGTGFEYMRRKYTDSLHKSYALIAAREPFDPIQSIREYEERYGEKMFPGTKPPGVVVAFKVLERINRVFNPSIEADARFLSLTRNMAYVFPILTSLAIVLIYLLHKELFAQEIFKLSGIFYFIAPNILLFPVWFDNAIYPSLFLINVLLYAISVRNRTFNIGVLAGLVAYLTIFFTFSMLPLLLLFPLLIGLDYWLKKDYKNIRPYLKLASGYLSGFAALLISFRLLLNYDLFQRYTSAMRVVRNFDFVLRTNQDISIDLSSQTIIPSLPQIIQAMLLNNLELGAAVGFPLFILFVWGAITSVYKIIMRKATLFESVMGGVFLTYLALNLYGQVQGEVSRIWMFWVPMIVILAAMSFEKIFQRKRAALIVIIIMQMMTVFLTFQFQDFIM